MREEGWRELRSENGDGEIKFQGRLETRVANTAAELEAERSRLSRLTKFIESESEDTRHRAAVVQCESNV